MAQVLNFKTRMVEKTFLGFVVKIGVKYSTDFNQIWCVSLPITFLLDTTEMGEIGRQPRLIPVYQTFKFHLILSLYSIQIKHQ